MLWTTALIVAAVAQAPVAPVEPGPGFSDPYVAPPPVVETTAGGYPDWLSLPVQGASHWGFENFLPRVGVQHRSQGYGYDSGYTSFDAFVPLYQEDFSHLTAAQGSILLDNYGDIGFVAGLVHRQHIDSWGRVVGGNFFYNYREQGGNGFNQIGFGIETLGNYLDWRMNGYLPLGDGLAVPNQGGGVTDAMFSGRSLLVNYIADKPLAGLDTEIGGIIPGSLDIFRAYAGLYHFQGDYSDSLMGVQGRVEARLRDSGVASVAVTNDGTFGTNVVFAIGLWFPGNGPRNMSPYGRAAARMGEDVVRNQNIVIERSPTKDPVAARWANGTVIDVVHVNSGAAVGGAGTPLLPALNLTDAQALAGPQSLIFVHANSQYTGESVVLQDGQQLLGEGVGHTIQSLYGSFLLPTVTPPEDINSVPLITGAPGTAVTLANNNTVSGFRITNSGGYGAFGNNVTNVTLDRLNISGSTLDGIQLQGAAGNIQVTENFLNNNGGRGLSLSTTAANTTNTIVISDNTILGNPLEGIDITTNGQSMNSLVMERNLVRISLGPAGSAARPAFETTDPVIVGPSLINITAANSSQINGRFENNDVEDSFARESTSPDEDPYFSQFTLNARDNSRVDIGFINNRFESDRNPLYGNPRNGSFGLDLNSDNVAVLRARLQDNTSSLNYAFSENYISTFQLENTLSTNTGTMFYFPTANFIETIPADTLKLPE